MKSKCEQSNRPTVLKYTNYIAQSYTTEFAFSKFAINVGKVWFQKILGSSLPSSIFGGNFFSIFQAAILEPGKCQAAQIPRHWGTLRDVFSGGSDCRLLEGLFFAELPCSSLLGTKGLRHEIPKNGNCDRKLSDIIVFS